MASTEKMFLLLNFLLLLFGRVRVKSQCLLCKRSELGCIKCKEYYLVGHLFRPSFSKRAKVLLLRSLKYTVCSQIKQFLPGKKVCCHATMAYTVLTLCVQGMYYHKVSNSYRNVCSPFNTQAKQTQLR